MNTLKHFQSFTGQKILLLLRRPKSKYQVNHEKTYFHNKIVKQIEFIIKVKHLVFNKLANKHPSLRCSLCAALAVILMNVHVGDIHKTTKRKVKGRERR